MYQRQSSVETHGSLKENINNDHSFVQPPQSTKHSKQGFNSKNKVINEWQQIILDWNKLKRQPRTYLLSEKGIPPQIRNEVWFLLVGNKLSLTNNLYQIFVKQSKTFKLDQNDEFSKLKSFKQIGPDIGRTFHLKEMQKLFHPGGPLSDQLLQLLQAFVLYRSDIGYVQGMTYVGAILLMFFNEYKAFVIFSSLITHPLMLPIYLFDEKTTNTWFCLFTRLMKLNVPNVYILFKKFNITYHMYLLEWIMTIFAKTLNPDTVCRIWDRMLFSGPAILWKCAIAILKLLEPKMKQQEFIMLQLKSPEIREEDLIKEISLVQYPFDIAEGFNQSHLNDSSSD